MPILEYCLTKECRYAILRIESVVAFSIVEIEGWQLRSLFFVLLGDISMISIIRSCVIHRIVHVIIGVRWNENAYYGCDTGA